MLVEIDNKQNYSMQVIQLSKIKQGKIRGVGRELERVCSFIKGGEERPH